MSVVDRLLGPLTSVVDDFVLQRGDGVAAYNLAVVVDDAAEGVEEVVRGDDLWPSTPRQVLLGRLLGLPTPAFAHVPLVLGPLGERLAKRDGAVTLADRRALGESPDDVRGRLARSLGLTERGSAQRWSICSIASTRLHYRRNHGPSIRAVINPPLTLLLNAIRFPRWHWKQTGEPANGWHDGGSCSTSPQTCGTKVVPRR